MEQNRSAEWAAGMISSEVVMVPPTGMLPHSCPDGQLSGISARLSMMGTLPSSSIFWSEFLTFSCSSSVSGWQATSTLGAFSLSFIFSGSLPYFTMSCRLVSSHPFPCSNASLASAKASLKRGPGLSPIPMSVFPSIFVLSIVCSLVCSSFCVLLFLCAPLSVCSSFCVFLFRAYLTAVFPLVLGRG